MEKVGYSNRADTRVNKESEGEVRVPLHIECLISLVWQNLEGRKGFSTANFSKGTALLRE